MIQTYCAGWLVFTRRLLAVLGRGVRDSLSPVMHNHMFKLNGMNYLYTWIDIPERALERFMEIARKDIYYGLNVTIPYKEKIVSYIEYLDTHSSSIGAVNTILFTDHGAYGYNTDYEAILKAVGDRIGRCGDAIIIGAGGSAKAAVYALNLLKCVSVYVVNRTFSRAAELCSSRRVFNCEPVDVGSLRSITVGEVSAIVSAVPSQAIDDLGLLNASGGILDLFKPDVVVDLSYRPPCTKIVVESARRGIETVNGLEILSRQGAYAWRYWFGRDVDWRDMYNVILSESTNRYGDKCLNMVKPSIEVP